MTRSPVESRRLWLSHWVLTTESTHTFKITQGSALDHVEQLSSRTRYTFIAHWWQARRIHGRSKAPKINYASFWETTGAFVVGHGWPGGRLRGAGAPKKKRGSPTFALQRRSRRQLPLPISV
jgi:hypothetical protein